MSDLFYQPAGVQLIIFVAKIGGSFYLNDALKKVTAAENQIRVDGPVSVFLNKQYRVRGAAHEFKEFTGADIIQSLDLIQACNILPEVPEKLRIQSVIVSPNTDLVSAFYNSNTKAQTVLIDSSALKLNTENLRALILKAITASIENVDIYSMSRAEQHIIGLAISVVGGMVANNLSAIVFDITNANQADDNRTFMTALCCALVLYGIVVAVKSNMAAQVTQQTFKLFKDHVEPVILEEPAQPNPILQEIAGRALLQLSQCLW